MKKIEYDLIFIVLTYRNTEDLKDFIRDTKEALSCKYKVVVVNSYYDERSYMKMKKIADDNNCDFVNVENKGYGYGNNHGIKYAKEKYIFKYLIISNPDIKIQFFSLDLLKGLENNILAPTIRTLTGKDQNPYYYSNIKILEWLKYYGYKKNRRSLLYLSIIINKIYRELRLLIDKIMGNKKIKIYASHGSFVIFGKNALNKLGQVYDERMFLFSEENHLARLARQKNIISFMLPDIKILHKEDGSVSLESGKMSKYVEESFITYFENWN